MKTLGRSVLVLEWLVFALATPVAINAAGVSPLAAFAFLGTVTVLVVVSVRLLPSRAGIAVGWGIQALALLSGMVLIPMLILGACFTGVWFLAVQLGTAADARLAAQADPAIDLTESVRETNSPTEPVPGATGESEEPGLR